MSQILDAAGWSHDISELQYHHGRHEISMIPGFCGTPTVALGAKSPDAVTFSCPHPLPLESRYTLVLTSGRRLQILVTFRNGDQVRATVLDRPNPYSSPSRRSRPDDGQG